ncbi:hypothetical protein ACH5RR_019264 [Cinchona calisaya]|uniref:Uncharacterized protein n=1 Tax=Cinchona calisaya TaxID=153742 RepID=A0ABD2ZSH9_9GENT
MILLTAAITAQAPTDKEQPIGLDDIPQDECCRYKCDVNCAVNGFINQTCVDKCLKQCISVAEGQCCRFKCDITCTFGGRISLECRNKCFMTCPPQFTATPSNNVKPSVLIGKSQF